MAPSIEDVDSQSTNFYGPLSWGYGLIIWRGGPVELHQSVCVLLHHALLHLEAGPSPSLWIMGHVPPHVWTDKSNSAATQDEGEDEAEVCAFCCQKRTTITVSGECK